MLQKIRDRIQGWIAGTIIALLAVAFVFWGIQYYIGQEMGSAAAVATVNGQKISKKQLSSFYQHLSREQLARNGGVPLSKSEQAALKKYALQSLIAKVVLLQSVKSDGFAVSDAQVSEILRALPEFQTNGQFDPAKLQQAMYASGAATSQQFMQQMQQTILLAQFEQGLREGAFVLPNELQTAYSLLKQRRSFGYFIIPGDKYQHLVTVSDQQVKDYYQQNKAEFMSPEKVQVSYLMLSPNALADKVAVSEQQLKQYYNNNPDSFKVPQRWQIEQLLVPLTENATTEQTKQAEQRIRAVAQALTEHKPLPKVTTSTTWLSDAQVSGELETLLKTLKPEQYSRILRTKQGFAIIKLLQSQAPHTRSFEQVKGPLKKSLQRQKVQQKISALSDQLASLTYTNPTTLKIAAKKLGLTVHTSGFFTRTGEKDGVFADRRVLAVVFSANVLQQGNNSNPINLKDGNIVVLRIKQKQKSAQRSFATVEQEIKAALNKRLVEKKAGMAAYQVQTELAKKNSDPVTIAQQNDIRWTTEQNVQRDNKTLPADLLNAVFKLAPSNAHPHPLTSVLLNNGNYLVIRLTGIQSGDFAQATEKQKINLQYNLTNFWATLAYRFYAKRAMDLAKVHIDEKELK